MKRFLTWLADRAGIQHIDTRAKVDEAIYQAFAAGPGKRALDYLIAEHYAFVTPSPMMAQDLQFDNGRRFVVQDILDSIERVQTPITEEEKQEEEVNA